MKIFILLSLFLKILCEGFLLSENSLEQAWSKAFENITRHLFTLETRMFINNYGVDSDTITSLFLKKLNENAMPFQLKNLQLDQDKVFLDSSALITFDNFEFAKDFNQKLILNNEYFKPLQIFIYCQNVTIKEIESLSFDVKERAEMIKMAKLEPKLNDRTDDEDPFGQNPLKTPFGQNQQDNIEAYFNSYLLDIIQYEYFLIEEESYIKLLTFLWFSPEKCGELTLIEVNKFDKITKKWENDKFSMIKMANLHGCTIEHKILDFDLFHPSLTELPLHLIFENNINANFVETNWEQEIDLFQSKGCLTAVGNDRYRNNDSFDLNFITFPIDYSTSRLRTFDKPEYYSEYEKLMMPFDFFTWVLIALFFMAAFATILVLYCCVKRSIRDFVIGSNVTTPSLNVTQIFFGIAQVVVPRTNFARFLTMMFILYCLIIRTAWQGKMYEFMQKDIEKPGVDTIEQMIELGYAFTMEDNFKQTFPNSEISKRGTVRSDKDPPDEKNIKGVRQINSFEFFIYVFEEQKEMIKNIKKEEFAVNICGLKFPRHHPLFEIYEQKLQQYFTHKLIKFYNSTTYRIPIYVDYQWPSHNEKRYRTYDEARVLTMKMLEPGFVIWTSSLMLAVTAFIVEWLITLKNFLVMRYILEAFYTTRHQNKQFKELETILRAEEKHIMIIEE